MNESKKHVQLSLGVSKEHYSNKDSSIHGAGQETGSAGTEWAFISILMIKVIKQTTTDFTTTNPNNTKKWSTTVTGFIDDKRILSTIPKNLLQQIPTALMPLQ